jgi:Tol biopolymer transport system component
LGTGEIWLYHRGGGSGVAMVERPDEQHQKELGEPAFSPDGRYIYFSLDSTPGPTFEYAQDSNGQIFEVRRHDLETGKTESFVSGPGGAVRPTPSPDGRYLAFVRRIRADSALFLKDLGSGREWPIYTALDQDLQEVWAVHGVYPNLDWTPDSQSIVFWAGGGIRRIDVAMGGQGGQGDPLPRARQPHGVRAAAAGRGGGAGRVRHAHGAQRRSGAGRFGHRVRDRRQAVRPRAARRRAAPPDP